MSRHMVVVTCHMVGYRCHVAAVSCHMVGKSVMSHGGDKCHVKC